MKNTRLCRIGVHPKDPRWLLEAFYQMALKLGYEGSFFVFMRDFEDIVGQTVRKAASRMTLNSRAAGLSGRPDMN